MYILEILLIIIVVILFAVPFTNEIPKREVLQIRNKKREKKTTTNKKQPENVQIKYILKTD